MGQSIMHRSIRGTASLLAALLAGAGILAGCGAQTGATTAAQAAAAAGPTTEAKKAAPLKLKIADINTNPNFRVAASQGFFAKHGIDAEIVTFATPAEGINSLFIKQTDVAFGADFPILNAVSKGEYSIIASTGIYDDQSAAQWRLLVGPGVKKAEDLKGKKLSNFRGTFVSYLWDKYLAEHNVSLKDVNVIGQGGFDEAYVALKKGEVDAVWLAGSTLLDKFLAIEGVHQLTDMSQTRVRVGSSIIVPNTLLKEHPAEAAELLKAVEEAAQYIKSHPDETAELLYKEVKQPKDAVLKDLPYTVWTVGFAKEAIDSFNKQKAYMVENGIIKEDFDLKTKISLDAVKKALPDRVTYQP
ncbi:ABC transporter substrate-binding protein [Gorillibacterium sp. sgz5001074]|uniref:ABC transporter substrate-binding protein n=1 Tax=Gorillibacterium sp. sgz5001074 TaxID=3446695 RepID=UPI003F661F7B